ncbi:MAG: hypothetical protein IMZ71_04145 [Chloroflexi bacterium]|nr:hypothetical protein [Chloroflexota bacterium]
MTLAAEQGKAAKELVYLLEIEVGHQIETHDWTSCGGLNANVFWMNHLAEGAPSKVQECERATAIISTYVEKASIAECQATAKTWFYDSATGYLYVHTTNGDSPATASAYYLRARFWDRFCDKQFPYPREIVHNGVWYLPLLSEDSIPDVTLEVTPFSTGGIQQSFGSIKLFNGDGFFDAWLNDYIYSAAQAVLKVGSPDDAYAAYATLWKGWTGNIEWGDAEVNVSFEDERRIAED